MILQIRKIVLFLGMALFWNTAFAQKENYVWYFGDSAGIDFNSGVPVALTNSAMFQNEGCSSISDSAGNILFYTNGIKVWDRNHNQMPNGDSLAGHQSSTQSALIVPFPGNNSIYYIFTTGAYLPTTPMNFCYSIVDMSLNNNYGDVSIKNILLESHCSEKLAGIKHSNNTDIWVVVPGADSDTIYSYLVTASGLATNPVKNNSLWAITGLEAAGYLKISHDGSKLAYAGAINDYAAIFDFNTTTGVVSYSTVLNFPYMSHPYGIEFSASDRYLYCTTLGGPQHLFQYDFVLDSITFDLLFPTTTAVQAALQMGPDGKIYCAKNSTGYLGVINYPDSAGFSCNFIDSAVYLNGKICREGLPNFITTNFLSTGINSNNPQQNQLTISSNPATDKITISFARTTSENVSVKIYSVTGEKVFSEENKTTGTAFYKTIDVNYFSNGIYFLSVQTDEKIMTRKIVVQH